MKYVYIMLSILMILASCSHKEEDEVGIDKKARNITLQVFYKKNNNDLEQFIDFGANVYIYYRFKPLDFTRSRYQGSGNFLVNNVIISPDSKLIVKNENLIIDNLPKEEEILVVVESNYYQEKILSLYYDPIENLTSTDFIFNP